MFKKYLLFSGFFLLFFQVVAFAGEFCSQEAVCIITKEESGKVSFYAHNQKYYDITITINFPVKKNLISSALLPYTESISGQEKKYLFTIKQHDKRQAWRYNFKYHWRMGSIYAKHQTYNYELPYEYGETHRLIQGFNGSFSHNGETSYALDWEMPVGTPVLATREGTVADTRQYFSEGGTSPQFKDKANYVFIRHEDLTIGRYYHFRKDGLLVKTGQKIRKGQLLGYSGNTGYSGGPHLHFDVIIAIDGNKITSIPIRFQTSKFQAIILEQGNYYTSTNR